jgi:hypothetical protein
MIWILIIAGLPIDPSGIDASPFSSKEAALYALDKMTEGDARFFEWTVSPDNPDYQQCVLPNNSYFQLFLATIDAGVDENFKSNAG